MRDLIKGESLGVVVTDTSSGYRVADAAGGLDCAAVTIFADWEKCTSDERHVIAEALRACADDVEQLFCDEPAEARWS